MRFSDVSAPITMIIAAYRKAEIYCHQDKEESKETSGFVAEDSCFGIKSRRRSIKTEDAAGSRDCRCAFPHIIQHGIFCGCLRIGQEQISGFRVISLNGPEHSDQGFLHQVIRFKLDAGITLLCLLIVHS